MEVTSYNKKDLDNIFKWKTQEDEFIPISEMKTKHLFYTWLMIWNHIVPSQYTIWFNKSYEFSKFYTGEYMSKAFEFIYKELKSRNDIGYKMQDVISKIENIVLLKQLSNLKLIN